MPRKPRLSRTARDSARDAVLAIDFGTSNSTAGYPAPSGPTLVALEDDHVTLPSAIFFNTEDECVQFGRGAISAYTQHYEGRLLRALKSVLGSSLIEGSTSIGSQQIAFKDIIGLFLRYLKTRAETQIGKSVEAVVLGRPVHFVDDDEARDRTAQNQLEAIARACGFKQVDFQYEPIAAALDYEARIDTEELALIADLGGGTADISIVRVSPAHHLKLDRKADVLASTGVHIGGTDYDKRLSLDQVMPHLGYRTHQRQHPSRELSSAIYFDLATWHRIVLLNDNKTATLLKEMHYIAAQPALIHRLSRVIRERTGHQLAGDVETAKIALSGQEDTTMALPYIDDGLAIDFSRSAFEHATRNETQKIVASIHECLSQAAVQPSAIATLFLTGGTSAIPSVHAACQAGVPNARIIEGDRFGSVGTGLTIYAGVLADSG